MANERRDDHGETPPGDGASSQEALERTLRALGPLLRRRARVEAPRRAFVTGLRARLLGAGVGVPESGSTRHPGAREPRMGGGPPRALGSARRRAVAAITLAVALLALLALGAVALGRLDLALVVLTVMVIAVLIVALNAGGGWRP